MRTAVVALSIFVALSGDVLAKSYRQCHPLLQGRVLDRAGAPIPEATISVSEDLSSPDRERPTTRADGTYRLDSVEVKCPTPTSLTITVSAKGYAPSTATRQAEDGVFRFEHILDRTSR
jgi:hypothetical protein